MFEYDHHFILCLQICRFFYGLYPFFSLSLFKLSFFFFFFPVFWVWWLLCNQIVFFKPLVINLQLKFLHLIFMLCCYHVFSFFFFFKKTFSLSSQSNAKLDFVYSYCFWNLIKKKENKTDKLNKCIEKGLW